MNNLSAYHHQLVEVIYDDEFDKLDVGFMIAEDENHILLQFVDSRGFDDGYNLIKKSAINMLKVDTHYLKRIALLHKMQQGTTFANPLFQHQPITLPQAPLLENLLQEVKNQHFICKALLGIDRESVFGFVEEVIDDCVNFEYLGSKTLVKKGEITHLYVNAPSQKIEHFIEQSIGREQ